MYYVASTWRRAIAFLIDVILFWCFMLPCFFQGVWHWIKVSEFSFNIYLLMGSLGMHFAYRVFFVYFFQGTLGQLIMGLRIKSIHRQNIQLDFAQAFVRTLSTSSYIFLKWFPFATALISDRRRHIMDILAETEVVQLMPVQRQLHPKRWIVGSLIMILTLFAGLQRTVDLYKSIQFDQGRVLFVLPDAAWDDEK